MKSFLIILALLLFLLFQALRPKKKGETQFNINQFEEENRSLFTGHISEIRAQFIRLLVGLTPDELRHFHFDGYSFHLDSICSYKCFDSVNCIEAQDIEVLNPMLPHQRF